MSSKYRLTAIVPREKLETITQILMGECLIVSTVLCDDNGQSLLKPKSMPLMPALPTAPPPPPVKPVQVETKLPLRQLPDNLNKQPRAIYRFLEAEGTKTVNEIGNFLRSQGWAYNSTSSALGILKQMNLVKRNSDGSYSRL